MSNEEGNIEPGGQNDTGNSDHASQHGNGSLPRKGGVNSKNTVPASDQCMDTAGHSSKTSDSKKHKASKKHPAKNSVVSDSDSYQDSSSDHYDKHSSRSKNRPDYIEGLDEYELESDFGGSEFDQSIKFVIFQEETQIQII